MAMADLTPDELARLREALDLYSEEVAAAVATPDRAVRDHKLSFARARLHSAVRTEAVLPALLESYAERDGFRESYEREAVEHAEAVFNCVNGCSRKLADAERTIAELREVGFAQAEALKRVCEILTPHAYEMQIGESYTEHAVYMARDVAKLVCDEEIERAQLERGARESVDMRRALAAKLDAAERERDELRERARTACATLVEEFGADGPCNVEQAAERAVAAHRELREREGRLIEVIRSIALQAEPNADTVITCVVCGEAPCERSFVTQGNGKRHTHGLHAACVAKEPADG